MAHEDTIKFLASQVTEIKNYLARDEAHTEGQDKDIQTNSENNQKLQERFNEIATKITHQSDIRLRELSQVKDTIHNTIRDNKKHFDNSLRRSELTFNEFKDELVIKHEKIKADVVEDIESKFLSYVKAARWIGGALFAIIVALISSLSAVSLYVLSNIQTDIKDLERVVLYGADFKTSVEEKKKVTTNEIVK